jgi:hypothetical protein
MAAPYPHWEVIEVSPGSKIDRIKTIMGPGSSITTFRNMLIRIGKTDIPGYDLPCQGLYIPDDTNPTYFYGEVIPSLPHSENERFFRHYVAMDTVLHAPVGYMSIARPATLSTGVFTHKDYPGVKALAVYIYWGCSFTMSPFRTRAGEPRFRDYYAAQAAAHTLKLAKFMHNRIAEQLLAALGRPDVQHVIFYSIGAAEARAQHRKNGKLDTCTFMDEWFNDYGHTITEYYDKPDEDNTMFYMYMPGGGDFIGSALYNRFMQNISDISVIKNPALPEPALYKDDNYRCMHAPLPGFGGGKRRTKRKNLSRRRRYKKRTQKK